MAAPESNRLDPIGRPELAALAVQTRGTTRRLQCRTVARGGFRQEHHIRDLAPFGFDAADQTGLLGEQTKPTPSEMLLSALASCLVIGIHANAVARAIPIVELELVLSADLNFGALWGTGDLELAPIGFEEITIAAHIRSDAPFDVLQSLMDYVLLWSPVANSLHNPISLTAAVAHT